MTTQIGYVALASPPAQTNAGSQTTLTFAETVTQITVQNNTSSVVNVAFDSAASAGSFAVPAGATLIAEKQCKALHVFTAAAQNVNGASASNIVILGEV